MPQPPYARLLVKKNAGAPGYGPVTAVATDTIVLSAEDTSHWNQAGRFEIFAYPPGFAAPVGWSTAADGTYFWLGTGPAPTITLPASPSWGKYLFRLHVNGGALRDATGRIVARAELTDESAGVEVLGPGGERDVAVGETTQFHADTYIQAIQTNVRLQAAGGGGGIGADPTANSIRVDTWAGVGDPAELATTGQLRMDDSWSATMRNGALSADGTWVTWNIDGADVLGFGHDTVVAGMNFRVATSGTYQFHFNGTSKVRIDDAGGGRVRSTTALTLEAAGGVAVVDGSSGVYVNGGGITQAFIDGTGIALCAAAGSYGGGSKVLFIGNRTTAPTTNPTGGYILYAESGALKGRGTSGTITTIGVADPHCPTCGADFMTEHESEVYGYLAICLKCMADHLGEQPWIRRSKAA